MSFASSSTRRLRGAIHRRRLGSLRLGAALWRKSYAILRPTILVGLFTFVMVTVIPAKYQSEARVLMVGRDNVFLRPDADKDMIDRGIDQEAVISQAQLILSRDLASEVIEKLKLNELPEFDPALGGVSPIRAVLGLFGIIRNPMSMTPEERVLEAYYNRLTVYPVDKSRVIVIDFLQRIPSLPRASPTPSPTAIWSFSARSNRSKRSGGQVLSGEINRCAKGGGGRGQS